MNISILTFLVLISTLSLNHCVAQDDDSDMLSHHKPKTKTEKLVLDKLRSLTEIKDHYKMKGEGKPDIMIDAPDSDFKNYRFQVGFLFPEIFRTYFWLSIDPKTLQVYYIDFDDEGMQDIPIEKWRYWRNRPEFKKLHKWVKGKN